MAISQSSTFELSASARDSAKLKLERALGPSKILTDKDACAPYAEDYTLVPGVVPDVVVRAETAEDILATLRVARETGVPVTPRAAGTGLSGGSVPAHGGIVLSVLGMKQVKEISRKEGLAVVEPGLILGELHRAAEAEGWFYPPDANSWEMCALGGNVAENAGGPRAFKYGVTRDYVLGVEAFLIGGQRIFAGRRTKKGVTGYDVAGLLVGSEGTLAVFGDITLRLVPKPSHVMTLMALFEHERHAGKAVEELIAAGLVPRCIEFLDSGTLQAMRDAGNAIPSTAGSMLLMDVDGDERACEDQAERIAGVCDDVKAVDLLAAQDAAQRERLWAARREMSLAVRRLAKHKLSEDIVVPRQRVADLLARVRATAERLSIRTLTYGHAGDGNLHVNFLWNDEEERTRVDQSTEQLFRDTVELGGTLSGEHGIGLAKAPYLRLEQSPELIQLQLDLKRVFDPQGLLNPGKIFPRVGHGPC